MKRNMNIVFMCYFGNKKNPENRDNNKQKISFKIIISTARQLKVIFLLYFFFKNSLFLMEKNVVLFPLLKNQVKDLHNNICSVLSTPKTRAFYYREGLCNLKFQMERKAISIKTCP